jgi:hypothetical protein
VYLAPDGCIEAPGNFDRVRATVRNSDVALHHGPCARTPVADLNHLDNNFAGFLIGRFNKAVPNDKGPQSFTRIGLGLLSSDCGRDTNLGERR